MVGCSSRICLQLGIPNGIVLRDNRGLHIAEAIRLHPLDQGLWIVYHANDRRSEVIIARELLKGEGMLIRRDGLELRLSGGT
jgi:hypothetical protein